MKGCFVYLVNHTEQAIADGAKSLALLQANYLRRFPTPVLLFHEAGLTDAMKVRLAAEAEYRDVFPDCEIGAMPPFGHLYGLRTYVTSNLADEAEIAFNAGTHTDVIKMAYEDFAQLVNPQTIEFCTT